MERYAMVVAGALKNSGHQVVMHCREADQSEADKVGVELDVIHCARFPRKLRDWYFFRAVDRVRAGLKGPQITFCRVRASDLAICGGTHRGYLGRARKWTGPFDLLQIALETRSYESARTIISHSDLCRDELIRLYHVSPNKIVTLYPPVDSSFTPPASEQRRAELRRQLGLPPDKVVFLFPSMGHRRKGLAPIRAALDRLPGQFVLAVAGKPPAGRKQSFVHYLGYLNDMTAAYQAADFSVLGSYYEPFGLVGPESILCGTALVFEENIGCLPVVDPRFALTFSIWDVNSIRRALGSALELAGRGEHRIGRPSEVLRYNPSVNAHVQSLLAAIKR